MGASLFLFIPPRVVDKTALKTKKNEKNEKHMIFTCDFHK
jgi:hypothetical protein